jgi:2-polyprenyl-6-methoxyphenol hydroxylase-like FAD-dependent oxidoreductase
MTAARAGRVVVVGGSMAGLLAARALADHAESVVVLERDRLPAEVAPRGRVPQGRHLHVLLSAGLERLREWFPGIEAELTSHGAVPVDGSDAWVHQGGGYRTRGYWGRPGLGMTRPLLEHVVRGRVAALPCVTIEDGMTVGAVTMRLGRVTGVVVDGEPRTADLVVDCSGRSSRIAHDLAASQVLDPPVTTVGIDIGYTSFFLRRSPGDFEGMLLVSIENPGTFRGGAVVPVEGDRWQVTLSGVHGDVPPTSDAEIERFAASLSTPAVAQLIRHCERVSDIETYRFPSSRRRHYEKVHALPAGFVTVGDASSSFDPIYGQGMTSSALQAAALGDVVARTGIGSDDLPKRFHRKAARIIEAPWRIAVGGDFGHPQTVGTRPVGTAQLNGYMVRVIHAAHASLPVTRSFNRVLQLEDPPTALFAPTTVLRVLRASGRSPAVTGAPVRHPQVGPPRVGSA